MEDLTLDYDTVTDNDKLFSLRFQQCITMADASQSQKIYHIDKTTGKMNSQGNTLFSKNIM